MRRLLRPQGQDATNPKLPFEIVERVIRLTDPEDVDGRHSLVSWAMTSRAFWSVASKTLYYHVTASRKRLIALITGYQRHRKGLSPRAHLAFSFIHRLTLIGFFGTATISLWDMAIRMTKTSDAPLFPNVSQLVLREAPWSFVDCGHHDAEVMSIQLPPLGDRLIFDHLDICAEDKADFRELLRFPIRRLGRVYLHHYGVYVLRGGLPRTEWDELVIFSRTPLVEPLLPEQYRESLRNTGRSVSVVLNTATTITERFPPDLVLPHLVKNNPETSDIIRLQWFDPDQMDECPSCDICGKRWEARPPVAREHLQWMPYPSWRWHKRAGDMPDLPPHPRLRKTKENERRMDIAKGYIPRRISYVSEQLARRLRRTST